MSKNMELSVVFQRVDTLLIDTQKEILTIGNADMSKELKERAQKLTHDTERLRHEVISIYLLHTADEIKKKEG